MADKLRVGIIGCGNIAPRYAEWGARFTALEMATCADVDMARADALASRYDMQALTVEDLLNDPNTDIVLNLTPPRFHTDVSLSIIAAGKHLYSEKPLALTREDGHRILEAAQDVGVRVGCAPDTFLGGGLQTCRSLVDEGAIGEPVAAVAFLASHGPESWHPDPHFFYQVGGGPLFDMGPYYLTALITLLGPVKAVAALTQASFPERIATSKARKGERIPVEVATHVAGTLSFASGPLATFMMSFDVWGHNLPRIEIYGSEGTLSLPDPNTFGGPVRVYRADERQWHEVPLTHSPDVGRGIGVADMSRAIQANQPHRALGKLAYHVLDVMAAFDEASESQIHVAVESAVERPDPLPVSRGPKTST